MAALIWAASAYHLKDREAWIGWDPVTCAQRRNLIVNNTRMLVREAARRPNLACQVLRAALPVLPQCRRLQYPLRAILSGEKQVKNLAEWPGR